MPRLITANTKSEWSPIVFILLFIGLLCFSWVSHGAERRPMATCPPKFTEPESPDKRRLGPSMAVMQNLLKAGNVAAAKALILKSHKQGRSYDLLKLFLYAYDNNQQAFALWLLENTEVGSLRDFEGKTLLMIVAAANKRALTRVVARSKKVDINAQTEHGGWTALMDTCDKGLVEIVKILLDAGADVRIKDFEGRDALWWAESSARIEIVRLLRAKR